LQDCRVYCWLGKRFSLPLLNQSMTRPDKICTFCGKKDGPFHKEDVLAKWMMRELPHKKPWTKVINKKTGKFFVTRSGLGLVARAVCKTCNGGWMSRLECLARPILQPMMRGKPRTLSAEDQLILVRWLMKTAMMMEFVPDAIPMFFQSEDRRGFFESFAIPDNTVMVRDCIQRRSILELGATISKVSIWWMGSVIIGRS